MPAQSVIVTRLVAATSVTLQPGSPVSDSLNASSHRTRRG